MLVMPSVQQWAPKYTINTDVFNTVPLTFVVQSASVGVGFYINSFIPTSTTDTAVLGLYKNGFYKRLLFNSCDASFLIYSDCLVSQRLVIII